MRFPHPACWRDINGRPEEERAVDDAAADTTRSLGQRLQAAEDQSRPCDSGDSGHTCTVSLRLSRACLGKNGGFECDSKTRGGFLLSCHAFTPHEKPMRITGRWPCCRESNACARISPALSCEWKTTNPVFEPAYYATRWFAKTGLLRIA